MKAKRFVVRKEYSTGGFEDFEIGVAVSDDGKIRLDIEASYSSAYIYLNKQQARYIAATLNDYAQNTED